MRVVEIEIQDHQKRYVVLDDTGMLVGPIVRYLGNVHWIDVNQKNLDERVRPTIALLRQGHIVAKTDKQEREYTDEEWKQRQQGTMAVDL